jgi:hypothetical protein
LSLSAVTGAASIYEGLPAADMLGLLQEARRDAEPVGFHCRILDLHESSRMTHMFVDICPSLGSQRFSWVGYSDVFLELVSAFFP